MTASLALAALLLSQAPAPQAPAGPGAPGSTPASAPQSIEGDLWLVIYSVLPDHTDAFDGIARQVRAALAASPDEVRKAQARGLRIHKSMLPNAQGRILYFLQVPALTGDADRTGFDTLIDAVLPAQATALKTQLQAALDASNPSGNTYLVNIR